MRFDQERGDTIQGTGASLIAYYIRAEKLLKLYSPDSRKFLQWGSFGS